MRRIAWAARGSTHGRSQMHGGKNWMFAKEINANRFFWDFHWLKIWKNIFFSSMGPNKGTVAMDSKCNWKIKHYRTAKLQNFLQMSHRSSDVGRWCIAGMCIVDECIVYTNPYFTVTSWWEVRGNIGGFLLTWKLDANKCENKNNKTFKCFFYRQFCTYGNIIKMKH
jgi:hypothetical protein